MKWFEAIEDRIESWIGIAHRFEPAWSRRNAYRLWFPIVVMICFVVVDNFRPADPRGRMMMTSFEVEADFGLRSFFYSLKKYPHISYFVLLGLFLRRLWGRAGFRNAVVWVILISVFIEIQQGFIAGRQARIYDLLPNLMGLWLAWVYVDWRLIRGRGFCKEPPQIRRQKIADAGSPSAKEGRDVQ